MSINEENLTKLLKERDEQLRKAHDKINELENDLSDSKIIYMFSESERMMVKIIETEIKRIHESIEKVKLTRDEIKLFDTLVKDFVAIRGKVEVKKTKETEDTEESIENLVSIVMDN